jgi:hypothetical protein
LEEVEGCQKTRDIVVCRAIPEIGKIQDRYPSWREEDIVGLKVRMLPHDRKISALDASELLLTESQQA